MLVQVKSGYAMLVNVIPCKFRLGQFMSG